VPPPVSVPNVKRPIALARRLTAEAVGTFCLLFAGTGAIVVDEVAGGPIGHGGIAAAFGLVIVVMIASLGHISGAHFNPAITVAFASTRHFPWKDVAPYIVAQIVGALAASLTLRSTFGDGTTLGVTAIAHVSATGGLALEIGLTAVLALVIMSLATDTRSVGALAAVAIGATVGLEALVMGPITGAAMNPARSLAPAIVAGNGSDLWLYIVGPFVGAVLGAALYQFLRAQPRSTTQTITAEEAA
jgi:aquaporin NIP